VINAAFLFAAVLGLAFPAQGDPVSYESLVAAESAGETTAAAPNGEMALTEEQQALMDAEARWSASASLYHAGGGGATGNDSLGCKPIAMRTVAVDPRVIPRRTRLFIKETVGMRMPDGSLHDGYWYASDTGGAIRGQRVDLYTGHGRASMQPAMRFNQRRLSIVEAGRFEGCPPAWDAQPTQMASL